MGYLESGLEEMLLFLEKERDYYNNLIDPSLRGELIRMNRSSGTTYLHNIPVQNEDRATTYSRKAISYKPKVIRALATNAYAKTALKINENNFRQIKRAQDKIMEMTQDSILSRMKESYRELPKEYYSQIGSEGVKEEYRNWMQAPFVQSNYRPEKKKFDTGRGIYVRSKAEIMFVEKYYQYGVPFHYEEVIQVNGYELAPDFTFPSRDGGKFYLEYCGMMDNPEYVEHFLWKRRIYEGIGITEWDNMIYVFDSHNNLDMSRVDSVIRTMILPRL